MLAKSMKLALVLLACGISASAARACPFCEAASPTWLQSVREADAGVIASVAKVDAATADDVAPVHQVTYTINEALRGLDRLGGAKTFHLESLEPPTAGALCLMTAVGAPDLSWSTLVELTPARAEYFAAARKLETTGVARWQFFYRYLEHADEELANDAYGEFAAASFAEVKEFAPHADREQLWRWIESDKTPQSRRGLYYTLLGLCGEKRDAAKLRQMLTSPEHRPPGAFSALVACYVSLCGEPGLVDVERQFFGATASEADAQAAIVALRFHGEEQHVLKRERVGQALQRTLERKDLAGSVIPDLARWQDWRCLGRLVTLFETSDGDDAWLRIPIVAYLKVCPLEEAKTSLEKLRQLDPQAVEQAEALSLFGAQLKPGP